MPEVKFSFSPSDISINQLGEVEIRNTEIRSALQNMIPNSDIVSCTTNNGCGNEVNGQGCGKVNGKCGSSLVPPDQFVFPGDSDITTIRDYTVGKSIVSAKLEGVSDIGLVFNTYKSSQ